VERQGERVRTHLERDEKLFPQNLSGVDGTHLVTHILISL
jgi:hypothetical protein